MRRYLVVVCVAALLCVPAAGCLEVRDRPAEGDFAIHLETPPVLVYLGRSGNLTGSAAELTTDMEGDVSYSWDIGADGRIDYTYREPRVENASIGVQLANYILGFHDESRNTTMLLAFSPDASTAAATVADVRFSKDGAAATASYRTPLEVVGLGNLSLADLNPFGAVLGTAEQFPTELALNVTLPAPANGSVEYVAAFRPWSVYFPGDTVQSLSVVINAGETHRVSFGTDGALRLTIWNASGDVLFEGLASAAPGDRHVEVRALDWEGRIGEEETPGPSAAVAAGALLAVGCAVVASRRGGAVLSRRQPR
jgi:hypothetical protein